MSKELKYFNKPQMEAMAVNARDEFIVASRGLGKSEGFDARVVIRNVFAMPKGNGAVLSPTYSKLLQNTLPAIAHALANWGYHRNIHYYIGRKAPKTSGFDKPYIEPFSYEHVISWFNGSIQHLVSFDRSMSTNSMSLDYVIGPEAKFLSHEKIKTEVNPALRGNRQYFQDCPWHGGSFFSTDMPTSKMGMWILEKEKEMDPELIELIKLTYLEYKRLKAKPETVYRNRALDRVTKNLAYLRKEALFFAEYNVLDNVEILGEKWIAQQKRDLPPLIFRTAIMNERLGKVPNGFYSSLEESIHFYVPRDNGYLDTLDYDFRKTKKSCSLWDGDVIPTEPLRIAFDYNAPINNMVIGQPDNNNLNTLKSIFVKTPLKLRDLVNAFCDYYAFHQNKDVVYYYDATAVGGNPVDGESFASIIISPLSKRGWNVIPKYIGGTMRHDLKHQYIDDAFKGNPEYLFPQFNLHNNEYLKLAMEQTGIKQGRNGFEKDKSAEKDPDSPEQPDETKTHITDAWDTLFIGCNFYPVDVGDNTEPSNIIGK